MSWDNHLDGDVLSPEAATACDLVEAQAQHEDICWSSNGQSNQVRILSPDD